MKRKLGAVRPAGTREGLTRAMAEREMRRRIEAELPTPSVAARVTVAEAGARLLVHLEGLGRKRSTMEGYESFLRVHLAPFFGDRPLAEIGPNDVEAFIAASRRNGQSVKSTLNYLGLLHSIFEHAVRRGWTASNPCKRVEKPKPADVDADVRFLDGAELDALLAAVPADDAGRVERVLHLAAAMSGMRQGELLALRWGDVDWAARRIRVRRNLVRGEFGTPKSKRSSRSVPLADVLGGELDRLFQTTVYQRDADLVFCHPHTEDHGRIGAKSVGRRSTRRTHARRAVDGPPPHPRKGDARQSFDTMRIVSEMGLTALIVDDNVRFREAARRVVQSAGLEVIGEAEDGPAALAAASAWRPDVVLLDVRLPGFGSRAPARRG